jgi:O-acetyl-ADP-ribose deacetylase (regulator of RNase III)
MGPFTVKSLLAIRFVRGDATAPEGAGVKLIAHICNDVGAWGKGFVLALSRRWPEPAQAFKQWHRDRGENDFGLGAVQLVRVGEEVWVANMVAQHGLRPTQGVPPIRYEALERCLDKLAGAAKQLHASVHMPRIGCGLAGGDWSQIEPVIAQKLCEQGVPVTVYDFA